MGGAADSETLIGGYICTIGGCSTPHKQPRENAVHTPMVYSHVDTWYYDVISSVFLLNNATR